ncbi:MAG: hypothetical protein A2X86_01670 [Bdellovibrionales bacterium GWA2_49_15]|nr:MAG: hypothetical protein A2X86_01670 [Bdellovibrionales bacterium GWA2_49_15]
MRAYLGDRAFGLCSFVGDLGLGAFLFAILVGQTSGIFGQLFNEILALLETFGAELGIKSLSVHLFLIYALTLFLRALFILILGRGPGDMAIGRLPFGTLKERGKYLGQNLLMVLLPPLCFLPDSRRRISISWTVTILLLGPCLLWPWPMLWNLSSSSNFSKNEFLPISELKLDAAQGNFSQYVVFESRAFGLEALTENPENLLTFPCSSNTHGPRTPLVAAVCFFDVAQKQWIVLSMPGLFSLQDPLKRYLEFSRPVTRLGADNLPALVVQAMELGPYDGIKAVLNHGPFLQGILHFKLFLLQLIEKPSDASSLVKIGGRDFFQVKSENSEEWSVSFFPLDTHPAPMLKLSGPARSGELRERFFKTFLASIKWSAVGESNTNSLGALCDFAFQVQEISDGGVTTDVPKEDALVKLYTSVAQIALREKSVALRRLLLRSLQQFKSSKRRKISARLEKMLDGVFLGLNH